jgi:hypothetical protein
MFVLLIASSRTIALSWRRSLRAPMTQKTVLAGAQALGKATHARHVKSKGQTKCSPWSSRLGAGRGVNDCTPETMEEVKTHAGCSASEEEGKE